MSKETDLEWDDFDEWKDGFAVWNPNDKDLEELPTIFGFNNGGSQGLYHAQLLSEDGVGLGSHGCSNEGFMPGDLGIRKESWRLDRHETFQEYYPEGYKMDFVSSDEIESNEEFQETLEVAQEKAAESQ